MAEVTQILCPNCHKPNLRRAKFCQHCGNDVVLNNDGPRYYITRIIKEGGQGAVYETIGDDEQVYAVKEMLDRFTDLREQAEAIERFEHEAHLLQRLRHPRIPRVYGEFKDEGRQYLAMEFVRGEDLEEVVRRQGALPEQQVLLWADQICDVLAYLHNQRPEPIIFRDMKPSNIMVEPDGGIKLIDFGIAKVFQRAERGTQIGTPGYAPPEQYQGLATLVSDIYALGATLHHMLTGRDPRDEPPFSFPPVYGLNPRVSKRTSEAIQRALQMKPEDRYQSVVEFRAALRPLPPPTPQVRVASKTRVLPAQPPDAAPSPPVVTAARPATSALPTPSPAQPLDTAPDRRPRRSSAVVRGLLIMLLLLGLAGATLVVAFPDIVDQYATLLLGATAQPQPQLPVDQAFTTDVEVTVPAGITDEELRRRFVEQYTAIARAQFGAETRVNANFPPSYYGGAPQKVGDGPNGAVYRATVQGRIQTPQT